MPNNSPNCFWVIFLCLRNCFNLSENVVDIRKTSEIAKRIKLTRNILCVIIISYTKYFVYLSYDNILISTGKVKNQEFLRGIAVVENNEAPNWDYIQKFKELRIENNTLYPRNDIGITRLFFNLHSDKIRFVREAKTWYVFDSRRWIKE